MDGWFPQSWFMGLAKTPYLLETGPWWAVVLWLAAVGGCVGSFVDVVRLRAPHGEDYKLQGSRCPCCRHALPWWQNVPLVAWPLLRGKCYYCRAPIPMRYWLYEVAFAALFVAIGIATPWL